MPDGAEALFGEGARAEEAYAVLTVDVPLGSWISALESARDGLGCRFFDWLSAVDEPGTGFQVCAHLVALPGEGQGQDEGPHGRAVRRLLLRTTVPHEAPALPTATAVFAGAAWHERETHEMFGVDFTEHPGLEPLLLPESFEGHPLRKDFVLAARVAKAWPGAVEPGESSHGAPRRRQMLPPGVPDPNEWGPLKGQLPPVPSRPARGRAGRAGTGERPARRARSASEGSAGQRGGDAEAGAGTRRREGGQEAPGQSPEQSAEQTPQQTSEQPSGRTSEQPSGQTREQAPPGGPARGTSGPRSSDAPWHDGGDGSGRGRPDAEGQGKDAPGQDGRGRDAPGQGAANEGGADEGRSGQGAANEGGTNEGGADEDRSGDGGADEDRSGEARSGEGGADDGGSDEGTPKGGA
nr:NADH-quinone oxidoreductase subunit C [Streptomyces sp. HNM0575]